MSKLEDIEVRIARVRELIESLASNDLKQLIDELEYLLFMEQEEIKKRGM